MQELRFVAVSEDGSYAVLAVPGRSGRYILPIDERLRAVAQGQTSRLAQYEIEVESPLRPKEIQARIRAGETAEEIADAAGIPVERVRWFEGPVLAERAYIAEQAQTGSVRRAGDSSGPGPRLGDVVTSRLSSAGTDPADGQWDSRKRGDGNWQVSLAFPSGGRFHVAEWVFDPRRRHVMPDDDNAARLSLPESELPPEPVSQPGEATVTPIASRLSAAAGMGGGGYAASPGVSRFRPERSVIPDRSLGADRSLADRPAAAINERPAPPALPAPERPAAASPPERGYQARPAAPGYAEFPESAPYRAPDFSAPERGTAEPQATEHWAPEPPAYRAPAPPQAPLAPEPEPAGYPEPDAYRDPAPAPVAHRTPVTHRAPEPAAYSASAPPQSPAAPSPGAPDLDALPLDTLPLDSLPAFAAQEPVAAPEPTRPARPAETAAAVSPAAAPASAAEQDPAPVAPVAPPAPAQSPAEASPTDVTTGSPEPAATMVPEPPVSAETSAAAEAEASAEAALATAEPGEPEMIKAAAAEPEAAEPELAPGEPEPVAVAVAGPAAAGPAADAPSAEARAAEEEAARQRPAAKKNAKGRRSSVPSWDEIMLGSSRQRE